MSAKPVERSANAGAIKTTFRRNLRQAMLRKGWYQSELARQAGLTRDQISTYCTGRGLPTNESLHKLAGALGVEASELLPERPMPPSGRGAVTTELKVVPGAAGKVWLSVDRLVQTSTALKIVEMLQAEQADND